MFQTKQELQDRIRELEAELDRYKARESVCRSMDELRKASGLGKCKGVICRVCEHAVMIRDAFGTERLVGCDKETTCSDYKRRTTKE